MALRIVGIVLVRNEDLYVEQAIRNVASFCDRIHVAEHMSTDATPEILGRLQRELPHVDVRRVRDAAASHDLVEAYAGTDTWVFGVDGDELYDPGGLARLRAELLAGEHGDVFRLKAGVLNCVSLDRERGVATGHLAPPSRSTTKLYNFAAIESWRGCYQRLHGGEIAFRPGFHYEAVRHLGIEHPWEEGHFRCLHACFVRRSSAETDDGRERPNLSDRGRYRRTRFARVERLARTALGRGEPESSRWKRAKYTLGDLVEKDVSAFFPVYVRA